VETGYFEVDFGVVVVDGLDGVDMGVVGAFDECLEAEQFDARDFDALRLEHVDPDEGHLLIQPHHPVQLGFIQLVLNLHHLLFVAFTILNHKSS